MTKKNTFAAAHFHDENAARAWFEAARWPNGPECPHCEVKKPYATKKLGRYRCSNPDCRRDFTVMTGTVMERSHAKLTQWAAAFHMGASSKKGFSAHQLHRTLGCQYNTAWFLHHRVMEAMRRGDLDLPPMGGEGKIVEADETYYGRAKDKNLLKPRATPYTKKGWKDKGAARPIIALVERGGTIRTWHVAHADKFTVAKIVSDNIAKESRLHTDESRLYTKIGARFAAHKTVHHSSGEYVREDHTIVGPGKVLAEKVHTNSAEGFFSIFKRGMKGVYQHCSEKHLHRYLAEFDFRYNYRVALGYNDDDRTLAAIRGAEGKRLTYHQPH